MPNVGQTVVRFTGALVLAAGATMLDHPPEGTGAGLEVRITPGKRAYSIRVNDAATFAGLIQPSARVDVLVVVDDRKQPGERQAWVVAEDVRVLAIGSAVERRSDSTYSRGAVVTLEVVPEDAELLAIAAAQGQMQIVLRGYDRSASVPRQVGSPSPVR